MKPKTIALAWLATAGIGCVPHGDSIEENASELARPALSIVDEPSDPPNIPIPTIDILSLTYKDVGSGALALLFRQGRTVEIGLTAAIPTPPYGLEVTLLDPGYTSSLAGTCTTTTFQALGGGRYYAGCTVTLHAFAPIGPINELQLRLYEGGQMRLSRIEHSLSVGVDPARCGQTLLDGRTVRCMGALRSDNPIQELVDNTPTGDIAYVEPGNYYVSSPITVNRSITLAGAVGSLATRVAPLGSTGTTLARIVSSGAHLQAFTFDESRAPSAVTVTGHNVLVEHVKIEDAESMSSSGGGLAVSQAADVTLDGLSFSSNSAATGGALAVLGSTDVVINRVAFTNNSALSLGGALFVHDSNGILVADSSFQGNEIDCNNGYCGYGGAIHIGTSEDVAIIRGSFVGNSAWRGGALYAEGGRSLWIDKTSFTGNSGNDGGAIAVALTFRDVAVSGSTFETNLAARGGALWIGSESGAQPSAPNPKTRLSSCFLHANGGGAVYAEGDPELLVEASRFVDNGLNTWSGRALRLVGGAPGSLIAHIHHNNFIDQSPQSPVGWWFTELSANNNSAISGHFLDNVFYANGTENGGGIAYGYKCVGSGGMPLLAYNAFGVGLTPHQSCTVDLATSIVGQSPQFTSTAYLEVASGSPLLYASSEGAGSPTPHIGVWQGAP